MDVFEGQDENVNKWCMQNPNYEEDYIYRRRPKVNTAQSKSNANAGAAAVKNKEGAASKAPS